jgi:hypothetical protein
MAAVRDRITEDECSLPADSRLRQVETLLISLNQLTPSEKVFSRRRQRYGQ